MRLIPDVLKHYLRYNPETGIITWIISPAKQIKIGQEAGSIKGEYLVISFSGKSYLAHRVAWFLHYGKNPKQDIDHKNLIKSDNRLENLRLATPSQNNCNKTKNRNKTGTKGIYFRNKKWLAKLTKDRTVVFNKAFTTKDEAKQMLNQQRARFHGSFAKS